MVTCHVLRFFAGTVMWVVNSCLQEPLSLYVWHTDVLGAAAAASSKLAVLVASVAAGVQLVAFYCSAQHALCVDSCRLPNNIDHTQRVCPGVLVCVFCVDLLDACMFEMCASHCYNML